MKKLEFNSSGNKQNRIEITVQVRDKNGNPTGHTRSFGGDNFVDAKSWYDKQSSKKKKKRRKKKEESKK